MVPLSTSLAGSKKRESLFPLCHPARERYISQQKPPGQRSVTNEERNGDYSQQKTSLPQAPTTTGKVGLKIPHQQLGPKVKTHCGTL